MPQLTSAAMIHGRPDRFRRCAYQANVMKTFDVTSRRTVQSTVVIMGGRSGGARSLRLVQRADERLPHVDGYHRAPPLGIDDDVVERMALRVRALGDRVDQLRGRPLAGHQLFQAGYDARPRPERRYDDADVRDRAVVVQLTGDGDIEQRKIDRAALAQFLEAGEAPARRARNRDPRDELVRPADVVPDAVRDEE